MILVLVLVASVTLKVRQRDLRSRKTRLDDFLSALFTESTLRIFTLHETNIILSRLAVELPQHGTAESANRIVVRRVTPPTLGKLSDCNARARAVHH